MRRRRGVERRKGKGKVREKRRKKGRIERERERGLGEWGDLCRLFLHSLRSEPEGKALSGDNEEGKSDRK